MLLGQTEILQCPFCKALFNSATFRSGNTFGAVRWSDTKIEAPMMPTSPKLIKCHSCDRFVWVDKLIKIGEYEWDENVPIDWKNSAILRHLTLKELLEFLEKNQELTLSEEYYVRIRIHWGYNDPIRLGGLHSVPEAKNPDWHWNIIRLLQTLDWNRQQDRLLAAELMRNLKEWDQAIEVLNSITEPSMNFYRSKIQERCVNRNNLVFRL
ncbi:hypothetical protein [Algoriphagus sp. A40]|uniref:hypothetical protein n=1 Tax=Algoriphagus sp. A40 TaxID=1945863 RepID=UPI000985E848|nr:hypothetical protein [Algoriphagus sp. A40]OOG77682.1 hypothetical protein B0E43_04610 [Algoriphagus sp. A40]